jgi:hypothetical protein
MILISRRRFLFSLSKVMGRILERLGPISKKLFSSPQKPTTGEAVASSGQAGVNTRPTCPLDQGAN